MFRIFYISFLLLSLLSLTSCATGVKEVNLYDVYGDYATKLKSSGDYSDKELENLFQFFSPRYQTEILNGREPSTSVIRHIITKYFSTPLELKSIHDHFQVHNKNNSCLLINASNKKNERASLYITYVNKTKWLIDNVNVEYLSDQEQFLETPMCDVDVLMQKRIQAWGK